MSEQRTFKLRRYRLVPERAAEFLTEIFPLVVDSRTASGFTVEQTWVEEHQMEFTWILSYPGTVDETRAAEEHWIDSDARRGIFDGRPKYVSEASITIVDPLPEQGGRSACGSE